MRVVLNREVMDFIDNNKFDVNETKGWIDFVAKMIYEFDLDSEIIEDEDGTTIYVYSEQEYQFIEDVLYDVEETETSLEYIFEGNVVKIY